MKDKAEDQHKDKLTRQIPYNMTGAEEGTRPWQPKGKASEGERGICPSFSACFGMLPGRAFTGNLP